MRFSPFARYLAEKHAIWTPEGPRTRPIPDGRLVLLTASRQPVAVEPTTGGVETVGRAAVLAARSLPRTRRPAAVHSGQCRPVRLADCAVTLGGPGRATTTDLFWFVTQHPGAQEPK